jgi:hypothetical protein
VLARLWFSRLSNSINDLAKDLSDTKRVTGLIHSLVTPLF